MDREATLAPLLGAESLTPVMQGTTWLQVVLVEHVNQITSGQGVIQHVQVSLYIVAVVWTLHAITPCKLARSYVDTFHKLFLATLALVACTLPNCIYVQLHFTSESKIPSHKERLGSLINISEWNKLVLPMFWSGTLAFFRAKYVLVRAIVVIYSLASHEVLPLEL